MTELIKDLNRRMLGEEKDLSELPEETVKHIQKKIKEGAKDLTQKWSNALELTHKAYEVLGVQRPSPSMKAAWSQYEDMIAVAVKELADTRGINGDWRTSTLYQ